MKKSVLLLLLFAGVAIAEPVRPAAAVRPSASTLARWRREARAVTITRDNYGIAHIHGKTNADAVFGMEYAQAEDDFHRIEVNYINNLGLMAEVKGASHIYNDLRIRLFVRRSVLKAKYASSPLWLRRLMDAFADGLNYYLYTHPRVHPELITRFRPWMALAFTEGSIGGDDYEINLPRLTAFYSAQSAAGLEPSKPPAVVTLDASARPWYLREPGGSNGIAISASIALDHHSLLYLNPHVSFYFRSELQMSSDQGLDAYGAATWGQFFIYQGFNRTAGWMHTSSGVQNVDRFLETVSRRRGRYVYKYGSRELPLRSRRIVIAYKTSHGLAHRAITAYYTQHGPIIARIGGKWESVHLMQRPVRALTQDFRRMQARDYAAFRRVMQLHTNSSNNTIFADAEGNIAYWHADWIPRRSDKFDWFKPVDGSNPATAYHGLLSLAQTPHLLNPPNGWLYNSNNWPWSAAGPYSPKRQDFPRYVDRGVEESPRGYHALRLLTGSSNWTMSRLVAAGFDSYLPAFAPLIPRLLQAYAALPAASPLKRQLAAPVAVLRGWNDRWGINSVATSLAVFWGTDIYRRVGGAARAARMSVEDYVARRASHAELLASLQAAVHELTADFGAWQTPWGNINRYQRLDDSLHPHFSDARTSLPVPFTSSIWGSLAAYGSHPFPNTKKWYAGFGNSFVCVVEFGPRVQAWAVSTGGESGDPRSPHFFDQAVRYVTGNLRPVYFYPAQLRGHIERQYHPGH